MISAIMEPALLAVPPIANSDDEVEAIIDQLINWSKCVLSGGIPKILQMGETIDVLGASNCWPSGPNVQALLELYSLTGTYSVSEVSRLINTIIERAPRVEDELRFEVKGCTAKSGVPPTLYQSNELKQAGLNAFSTISSGFLPNVTFIAPACDIGADIACFKAEVDTFVASPGFPPFILQAPFSVFGKILAAYRPTAMLEKADSNSVWDTANRGIDVHFAIVLKMIEIKQSGGNRIAPIDLPFFVIGSEFFGSICANQCGPQSRYGHLLLETCARIVLGAPKNSIDPFMKGARSESDEQWCRDRDRALAFRTHLTKSHEALRLVLWRTQAGVFEFANVAVHNDLTLCQGSGHGAVSRSWAVV
jgi:hypothetical protein